MSCVVRSEAAASRASCIHTDPPPQRDPNQPIPDRRCDRVGLDRSTAAACSTYRLSIPLRATAGGRSVRRRAAPRRACGPPKKGTAARHKPHDAAGPNHATPVASECLWLLCGYGWGESDGWGRRCGGQTNIMRAISRSTGGASLLSPLLASRQRTSHRVLRSNLSEWTLPGRGFVGIERCLAWLDCDAMHTLQPRQNRGWLVNHLDP